MGELKTSMTLVLAGVMALVPVSAHVVWGIGSARADEKLADTSVEGGTTVAKLPTSETLRKAMEAIRYAVVINHTLVTHRRMPAASARQFEADITAQTALIRKAQGIPDQTAAAIEPILKGLDDGAAAIGKSDTTLSPMDGLLKIDEALTSYAQKFDHPGWKELREL